MSDLFEFIQDFFKAMFYLFTAVLLIATIGIVIYFIIDAFQAPQSKEQARQHQIELATPKLYATTDGCSVYRWYADGNTHYFTKCQDKVITESHHKENCGKACTRDVKEVIETVRTK